jgi:hypothetical protein
MSRALLVGITIKAGFFSLVVARATPNHQTFISSRLRWSPQEYKERVNHE